MLYDEEGSHKNREPTVRISRVTASGELEELLRADGWNWALELRDHALKFFEEPEESRGNLIEIAVEAMSKLTEEERSYVLESLKIPDSP